MSQTLFLKYRPQNFSDLVGQEAIIQTLKNALIKQKASHAYLFIGSRGTGKTSTARILAKALNSFSMETKDVQETALTKSISEGRCVDIIEFDAASNTGVDAIRDVIEKTRFLPSQATYKVYIIDEVHMLSKGAFNALLKTLEEPPAHVYFILATTEFHKVPETIVSRCQTFVFQEFTESQIVGKLSEICEEEGFTYEEDALKLIAKKAEGGMRDAIGTLEHVALESDEKIITETVRVSLGFTNSQQIEEFWNTLQRKDPKAAFQVFQNILKEGSDVRFFGGEILEFLRQKMHENLHQKETISFILNALEQIEKAIGKLKTTPIIELPFEIAIVNICGQKTDMVLEKKKPEPEISAEKLESVPLVKSANTKPSTEVSVQAIKKNIPEALETTSMSASQKRALKTASVQVVGKEITFIADSQISLEFLNTSELKMGLQTYFSKKFGSPFSVEFARSFSSGANRTVSPQKTTAEDITTIF